MQYVFIVFRYIYIDIHIFLRYKASDHKILDGLLETRLLLFVRFSTILSAREFDIPTGRLNFHKVNRIANHAFCLTSFFIKA